MGEVIDFFKMSNKDRLLRAVELAFRKHVLEDDSIGWGELTDELLEVLLNSYDGECIVAWEKQFDEGEKSLREFSKGWK